MDEEPNTFLRFAKNVFYIIDAPVTYFREKFVEANQKQYPWYHQKFRRVPTIAECYENDFVCYYEANCQYRRDKKVDNNILTILRNRYEECQFKQPDETEVCSDLYKIYQDASAAWFAKYGDLGFKQDVLAAFMKQKHRMIWERRHGPVGSGMNEAYETV